MRQNNVDQQSTYFNNTTVPISFRTMPDYCYINERSTEQETTFLNWYIPFLCKTGGRTKRSSFRTSFQSLLKPHSHHPPVLGKYPLKARRPTQRKGQHLLKKEGQGHHGHGRIHHGSWG